MNNEADLAILRNKLVSQEHDLEQICDRLCQYAQEFKVDDVRIELSSMHVKLQLRAWAVGLVKKFDKVEKKMRLLRNDVQGKIDELHRRCRIDIYKDEFQKGKFATATTEEVELLKKSLDCTWQCDRIDPPGQSWFSSEPGSVVSHRFGFYIEDLMLVQEGKDDGIPSTDFWYYPGCESLYILWRQATVPQDKRRTVYVLFRRQEGTVDGLKEE